MASLKEKIDCERRVRDWLDEHGLPEPDAVEYGFACIRVYWDEPKVVLVVDIDEPLEDEGMLALADGEGEVD